MPSFRCHLVRKSSGNAVSGAVESRDVDELPPGEVTIRVARSAINYKDALAASGHVGIVKSFPHVPGIDAAGVVTDSAASKFKPGERVFTTGHELGVERWGGWSELIRVPAGWVLPLPENIAFDEITALGTAGFTAAQCVQSLQQHGITPASGEVAVTGATGGVGSIAIQILARLGYTTIAVTGKLDQSDWLRSLGASRVVVRQEFLTSSDRPLLKAVLAGAIDTVGGSTLATMLKMIHQRGCVACCGMAGGHELATTVYPFILRGITLAGVDSAWCPDELRPELWRRLTTDWKPRDLMNAVRTVELEDAGEVARAMLAGTTIGRTLVKLSPV